MTPTQTTIRLEALCQSMGVSTDDALTELITTLEERRDLVAVAHPVWRSRNTDLWQDRVLKLYSMPVDAMTILDAVKELKGRAGQRIEDIPTRNAWRDLALAGGGQRCPYCQIAIDANNTEVDHRIPLARGGKDRETNWRLTCDFCNRGKSDRLDERGFARWRSAKLFKALVLVGKDRITTGERFDLLWRGGFRCSCCRTANGDMLAIYFRIPPTNGGQAVPENLSVVCKMRILHGDEPCPTA